jgi:hypothetical protein
VDFSKLERLHVSVYGARQFFPSEWRNLPKNVGKYGHADGSSNSYKSLLEEVHVSLRWLNGEFNDWSNLSDWRNDLGDDRKGARIMFNDHRTCYAVSTIEEVFSKEESKKLVGKFGRSDMVLPFAPSVNVFSNDAYREQNTLTDYFFGRGVGDRIPIVGIDNFASNIGLSFQNFGSNVRMGEGVEYLFGEVMPKIREFIKLDD